MKNVIKSLFLISLFVAGGFTTALSQTKYTVLAPKDFQAQLMKDNGFLMDVRTPEQYMAESIRRAKLCNIADAGFESILDMLEKANPVFVYDQDGNTSLKAGDMMMKKGYAKVYLLQGGMDAWKKAGLEIANMSGGK